MPAQGERGWVCFSFALCTYLGLQLIGHCPLTLDAFGLFLNESIDTNASLLRKQSHRLVQG